MNRRIDGRRAARVMALFLIAAAARADFADGLSSAAAESLGDAGAALPGEAASLFVNPAALAGLDQGDASLMYAKPLTGVPDVSLQQGVLAAAVPLGSRFTAAGGARFFDNAGLSKEMEGSFGIGMRLTGKLSAGAAASFLRREYDVDSIPGASSDPVFAQGNTASGVGFDAGVQYQASEELTLGAASRRLNRPDLGLAGEDRTPMTWRAGGAFRRGAFTVLGELRGRSESTSEDSKWGVGVEWRALGPLALRTGADSGKVAAGMGLVVRDLRVDYAFSFAQDTGVGESANHRMSVGFRFGPVRGEEIAAARPARPARQAPVKAKPAVRKAAPKTSVTTEDRRAYPASAPVRRKAPKRKTWVQ